MRTKGKGSLSKASKRHRLLGCIFGLSTATASLFSVPGCHRQYYRKQADQEVSCLLQEKSSHLARRPTADFNVYADRRSRMFNPFDLDFQPMPLDDPASNRYMQCVDGRRGYPMWEAAGITNAAESPDWWQFLPLDENGVLVLNNDTAVQLALLHSPDYQQQIEQLYLSALDVSSERFRFDTQFFANSGATFNASGSGSSSIGLDRDLTMNRAFATGSQLVVGLANEIVWTLNGPNAQSANTLLDFTFLQPFLLNAGRDVVMERLTLSERRLLSNVRAFERYRRSFYLNITIGRNTESTVSRSGGVFGVGLQGFSGVGSGFGGLGGGGGVSGGGFAGAQAGGFLGLLQTQVQIRNQQENIARLSETLLVLENTLVELLTTIPDDPQEIVSQRLQVAQQRSELLQRQTVLVGDQRDFQASLDSFLTDLGLPPYICVRLEDPYLQRFELIDTDLRSRRTELVDIRRNIGLQNIAILEETRQEIDPETGLPVSTMTWSDNIAESLRKIHSELGPLKDFLNQLQTEDADRVRADIELLADAVPKRLQQNEQLLHLYETEREKICTLLNVDSIDESLFDVEPLKSLQSELSEDLGKLLDRYAEYVQKVNTIEARLDNMLATNANQTEGKELADNLRENVILEIQDMMLQLGDDVLQLQLFQARARTESALLPVVDIEPTEAFEIARRNRRDWANSRASLVDQWRLIEFNADALESGLDLTVSGSVGGDGNSPWSFNKDNSALRMGLRWDAPITRLQERNTYRQALISFEQAKRSYYQYEDGIWRLLRNQIRQLQANRITFEYGRQSVRIATDQIELNEDIRELRDARGLSSGPTAARDTITALTALLNAQNTLLNVYVNYEVLRRNLQFDLGTMEITPEGMWIDQEELDPDYLLSLPGTTVEALPNGNCTNCCIPLRQQPQPPNYSPIMISEPALLEFDHQHEHLDHSDHVHHVDQVKFEQPAKE
ncbi:hypothetical protein LOC67_25740 [Stieleria sp. JC731]|uniref:TolC family protein n=1 Tax=Pirellulaceae TaxID=2691357 RepID=UPI001E4C524C|nr:TolC family protein [Stieleria sp. JC731]MCC9603969.1 hypothetical protein [Stieleria sp. JC731]